MIMNNFFWQNKQVFKPPYFNYFGNFDAFVNLLMEI